MLYLRRLRLLSGPLAFTLVLLLSAPAARGQIVEDYTAGDALGWEALDTWQLGKQIVGTEADAFPHPITGGDGPSVMTINLRDSQEGGGFFDTFQRTQRPFSLSQEEFDTHVLWLEYSSFANIGAASTERVKLFFNFTDDLGTTVQLQNNWNTRNASGPFGTRANVLKPRRAVLETDAQGEVVINPETQKPVVAAVLDGNAPSSQQVEANLNYQQLGGSGFLATGLEPDDEDPFDADGDQRVLNTLFEQQVVVRLDGYRDFESEAEWRVLNPDSSGDGNWRSLSSTGLGSGTEFGDPTNNDSLIITEPIRAITTLSVTAASRDIPVSPQEAVLPSVVRANQKISVNRSSTNGIPDNPDANHQVGLGRISLHKYHVGDVNRDGTVSSDDITATPLLSNVGSSEVTDPAVEIGDQQRDVTWVDGDTVNDGTVTVADAMVGVLSRAAGPSPSGPTLVYEPGTGGVSIDTGGTALSGFSLLPADDQAFTGNALQGAFNEDAIRTLGSNELSWMNLTTGGVAAGPNITGTLDLGTILPSGLTGEEFESYFAAAVFNVDDAMARAASFFGAPALPGDANGDGAVDLLDLDILGSNFGIDEGATVAQGDFNGDGAVDLLDLDILGSNFGAGGSASAPEPTTIAMALLGGFLVRRTRR